MMLRKLATSSLLRWSLPDIPKKAQAIRKTAMLLMTVIEYLMAVRPVLSFWSSVMPGIRDRWLI